MALQIPFGIVSQACNQTQTSVILIGGHAVAVRGYQRATLVLDFMTTEIDYEKLKPAMCGAGYRERMRTNVAAKLQAESEDLLDIDFMFVDEATFHGIEKESTVETFQGTKFLVPKVEHLIALKLHAIKQQPAAREPRDLNDIVELIKANQLEVGSSRFKGFYLKFGTRELYEKIIRYTNQRA